MKKYKLGFIGFGKMASAILNGIKLNEKTLINDIIIYDKNTDKTKLVEDNIPYAKSISEIVNQCEYILLCVKPQNFSEILPEIKKYISEDNTIISIAAGIKSDYIKSIIEKEVPIICVMPNTPITIGVGASAISYTKNVNSEQKKFTETIFKSCGHVEIIDESKLNYIIPINGSSPAFIYDISEHFVKYAVSEGISEKTALNLFCHSLIGSAYMILNSNKSISDLKSEVCSPGGTTLEGLKVFEKENIEKIITSACKNCVKRSFEISDNI